VQHGRDLQVLVHRSGNSVVASTALLMDRSLGTYRIEDVLSGSFPTFTAVDLTGSGPPITAAHTDPPVARSLSAWPDSTTAAVEPCRARAGIVAGDLNATLDHPAFDDLGTCVDALADAGVGGVGTWPTALPRVLGTPIDHVLADGREWSVLDAAVLDAPEGTDHRPVEAVLVPAG
jgi:endonuclease/exonuclease/phosphatase family metal-dependent hydrolase